MLLRGWVQLPHACQAQPACLFSYVNGRMMRDKLLNHAIRQAYGDVLLPGAQPAFVLYLELDPHQLDVNVHPAKHEVRFHQARLVHDFVVSALAQVCQQPALFQVVATDKASSDTASTKTAAIAESAGNYGAGQRVHAIAVNHRTSAGGFPPAQPYAARAGAGWLLPETASYPVKHETNSSTFALAKHPEQSPFSVANQVQVLPSGSPILTARAPWFAANGRYAVAAFDDKLWLVDASYNLCDLWLAKPPAASSLLLPLRLALQESEKSALLTQAENLAELGFDLVLNNNVLIVRAVPLLLRQTALSQWLPLWWQLWSEQPVTGVRPLLLQLLQSGLQQQWFSLAIFLNYFTPHLSEPSGWHAVPLDISISQQVLEAKR